MVKLLLIFLVVCAVIWAIVYTYRSYRSAQQRTRDVIEAQLAGKDANEVEKDECHCKWL